MREGVEVFSSNYELYGDLSERMMKTISTLVDSIDPYSIDECFANFSGYGKYTNVNLTELGFQIKDRVRQWVGIPTCVGIAPTKTLAKYCNHLAKHYDGLKGVCNWLDLTPLRQRKALACEPVSELWGVGRRYTEKLNRMGIETALDLSMADPSQIRKLFGLPLAMTVMELNGKSCIPLELIKPKRKQIMRSRSFGTPVSSLEDLKGALTFHAMECAATMRREKTASQFVGIVLQTNSFNVEAPQYNAYPVTGLPYPIKDTPTIVRKAMELLQRVYKPGYEFKRAGVFVSELVEEDKITPDLFRSVETEHDEHLSALIDKLNTRFGKNKVCFASAKLGEKNWSMNRYHLSPAYTTCWKDLPRVR